MGYLQPLGQATAERHRLPFSGEFDAKMQLDASVQRVQHAAPLICLSC
jgi:hypothetical protein